MVSVAMSPAFPAKLGEILTSVGKVREIAIAFVMYFFLKQNLELKIS